MDTLPSDLLLLLDTRLNPYEAILLDLNSNMDTKWLWYNYLECQFNYEIMKLCKIGDQRSLDLIKDFISHEDSVLYHEVILQILLVALKRNDDLLFNKTYSLYVNGNIEDFLVLRSIVYIETIKYNKQYLIDTNDKITMTTMTGDLVNMGYAAQWAINSVDNSEFDSILGYYHIYYQHDIEGIRALIMNPNSPITLNIEDENICYFLAILAAITDNVRLLEIITERFDDEHILTCAMHYNSHKVVEYLTNLITIDCDVVNNAHQYGYYYRPFWERIASQHPFVLHELNFFKPLENDDLIGNSIYKIELDNIKMLFSLSPPSKRELRSLANIAKEYTRYDIYCYCWELLARD